MVDRYQVFPAFFIANRDYRSFNTFTLAIEKEQKFLIRMKDIERDRILSACDPPEAFIVSFLRNFR